MRRAAVSDIRGFCERQPDACVTGGKVAVALGHKAEAGARTLYEFVSKLREKAAAGEKTGKPGADGTLTATDMARPGMRQCRCRRAAMRATAVPAA